MSFKEVKKELTGMEKAEIIKLVSELYRKVPGAKTYLDVFATGEIKQLADAYKKEIEKYVYPNGRSMRLREAEARKVIRTVQRMKIIELNVELELHYVSCCLEVIDDFGYYDNGYYRALENMFYNALSGIVELGLHEKYEESILAMVRKANELGIELSW